MARDFRAFEFKCPQCGKPFEVHQPCISNLGLVKKQERAIREQMLEP